MYKLINIFYPSIKQNFSKYLVFYQRNILPNLGNINYIKL